jgi:spermidine synthase
MPLQFSEYYNELTGLTIGVKRLLFSEQTQYQLVEVYETDTWGNLLTIDGLVMLSEKDEFVYHEMLTHVGLFTHPHPERVLIIGGGDGGSAREVLRHKSVEVVDMVEIDKTVVDASKKFLPDVGDFSNPKLNVIYEDGIKFVSRIENQYDMIIIDGSDPVGPAAGLFEKDFHEVCFKALKDSGVLTAQTESPWIESYLPGIRKVHKDLNELYNEASMYLCSIPLYPSGLWSMMCASKGVGPLSESALERVEEGIRDLSGLKYYNFEIHKSAFALPEFVKKVLA